MSPKKPGAREGGTAVDRGLDLIDAVAAAGRAVTVPELCALLDLPKPTGHRLCQRLAAAGYLAREPGGHHYTVGPRLMRLGLNVVKGGAGRERRAILQHVVDAVGETCNFTALAGDEVIYLDRVEARWPLRLHLEPGSRVPIHCTASGKLLLAHLNDARRARLLKNIDFSPFTPNTITSAEAFAAELAEIVAQGYSLDREEFLLGLVAIAVPVKDANGEVLAAIACHAPSARFSLERATQCLPIFEEAARAMAETLPQ